jgi:phosphatidylinositol alpha-1,6-mannosyltransferase
VALPLALARESRSAFAARIAFARLRATHFVYDFLGLARAHALMPWPRRPFLSFVHGIEAWEEASPGRIAAAHRAQVLVCNSQYTRQRAARSHPGAGFERADICWLATETDDPPSVPAHDVPSPPTVLMLGRLEHQRDKGHAAVIRCWPHVRSAVPQARLVIAGRGPALDDLRRLAAGGPAGESISFPGFVPEDQIDGLWNSATVFALPSRGEGFGLVYIEAMRHGVPVIASVHDAASELNLDGETGYNVDLDRADGELIERLTHLLRDRAAAAAMGRRGQQRWSEHFRFSSFRQRFSAILQSFLSG